jgi:hypothetical protein
MITLLRVKTCQERTISKIDRVEYCAMTNSKLVLAVGMAAATLVVFLAVTLSGGALRAGLAPWLGIGAIVLATAAFVVSWKQRSLLWAGLLAASGVTGIIAGVINTGYFAVIMFPGLILGAIIGVVILGLGVAKGIETLQAGRSKTRGAAR